MATHVRGAFTNFTSKDVKKVFFNEYARYPSEYSKVFYSETVDGRYENYGRAYGLGAVPEKTEGGTFEMRNIEQSDTVQFTFPTYSFGVSITEEMLEDDQTGIFGNLGEEMARSVNYTLETLAWPVLTGGFSSSGGETGTDGKTLFADDHPIGSTGGTQDNQSSGALSTTTLQAAVTAFKKQKNDANVPVLIQPKALVIPPDLEWKAKELMLSKLDPDSGNNAVNTLQGEGLKYMVFHFGSSTTNWFLLSEPRAGQLMSMFRSPMKMTDFIEPQTGNKVIRVRFRYQAGHVDWRGTYGSSGA